MKVTCHFSCGAASAVATKMAIHEYGRESVTVLNAFLASEHEDNRRFARDCEQWFGVPIKVVSDQKWGASIDQVYEQTRYMNGPKGAACSWRLKRQVLEPYMEKEAVHVMGFTAEEVDRLVDRQAETGLDIRSPLVGAGLTKDDCLEIIRRAGIRLPVMYLLGYRTSNCLGCVKGGEGYWRAIDQDFPAVYERRMKQQESIGPGAYFFRDRHTGERFGLRHLREKPGAVQRHEPMPACSFFCEAAERKMNGLEGLG